MAQKEKKAPVKGKDSLSAVEARKFKQNPWIYIGSVFILILVTVTFVGGDLVGGRAAGNSGDLTFGYYDGIPITWLPGNMFAQYRDQAGRYYQSQGADINDFRIYAQTWRIAFEKMVEYTAILQMMKKSHYTVPEKLVDRAVAQRPEFQENGRFSKALYQRMSDSSRLVIWRQTQDKLAEIMFNNDINNILIPSAEPDFIAAMSLVQRRFQMVYFKVDDYPEIEYLSYARENSELFNSIHLSKITISNEREAKKILNSIKDGITTFEDAARAQSQDSYADRGGDMGRRYSIDLNVEIPNPSDREAIFGLRMGELSDVIRSGEEWTFFRVEDELTLADFEDEAVIAKVRSYVRDNERGRMEDWALAQAGEFNIDVENSGLDNAARWRYLSIYSFGPIPINYGGIDLFNTLESNTIADFNSEYLNNLSTNDDFWKTAFSTELNKPSQPFVQGDNVLVFIPVEQIEAEETAVKNIASMYSSYWLSYMTEQSLQPYFMKNGKTVDNFWEIYFRYFMQ